MNKKNTPKPNDHKGLKFVFDEKFYADIFDQTLSSTNITGSRVSCSRLAAALLDAKQVHMGIGLSKMSKQATADNSISLDKEEFLAFCHWQEKTLWLIHLMLITSYGRVTVEQLKTAFKQLGFNVDDSQVANYIENMTKNFKTKYRDAHVSLDEVKTYYFAQPPLSPLRNMVEYWRNHSVVIVDQNTIDTLETITRKQDNDANKKGTKNHLTNYLLAGGTAGIVSRTCTAPIDRIKVLLQMNAGSGYKHKEGIISTFSKIYREGGVRAFWRGNAANCIKVGPELAIRFALYEFLKKQVFNEENPKNTKMCERFVCGSLAGAGAQFTIYPMEVLKTRIVTSHTGQYSGFVDAAVKIYQSGGVRSFYKGLAPSMLGIIPYSGTNLSVYEGLKNGYMRLSQIEKHDEGQVPTSVLLLSGLLASTCGQTISYPLVLVRTQMQVSQGETGGQLAEIAHTFGRVLRNDGPLGLYRGMSANFIKMLPSVGIGYVVYEKMKQHLCK